MLHMFYHNEKRTMTFKKDRQSKREKEGERGLTGVGRGECRLTQVSGRGDGWTDGRQRCHHPGEEMVVEESWARPRVRH